MSEAGVLRTGASGLAPSPAGWQGSMGHASGPLPASWEKGGGLESSRLAHRPDRRLAWGEPKGARRDLARWCPDCKEKLWQKTFEPIKVRLNARLNTLEAQTHAMS